MAQLEELVDKVIRGDWKEIAAMTQEVLDSGAKAADVIQRLQAGMEVVGEKYTTGEYFFARHDEVSKVHELCVRGPEIGDERRARRPAWGRSSSAR